MIRQPSTFRQLYGWWVAATRGENPPRHEGDPQCGWYQCKLVKGGPWVPARVWCEQMICEETGELTEPERLLCEIDGQRRDPATWWIRLRPITRAEYETLVHNATTIPAMRATLARVDTSAAPMRP
jgi:hypothetical protein